MPGLWFYTDPIDRLHQENLQFLKRQTFIGRHKRTPDSAHNKALEKRAVDKVITLANEWGYRVNPTTKNAPFDLWVEGAKVEVKASLYAESKKGHRYQAAIRNHLCDIVIFDCINGTDHLHFIPVAAIGTRRNIAVWSYDPAESTGLWRPFLEQPVYLHQAIEAANHIWQPPSF
jgi:hypothetical protein